MDRGGGRICQRMAIQLIEFHELVVQNHLLEFLLIIANHAKRRNGTWFNAQNFFQKVGFAETEATATDCFMERFQIDRAVALGNYKK